MLCSITLYLFFKWAKNRRRIAVVLGGRETRLCGGEDCFCYNREMCGSSV
ncbi:MAG: hypothetical protein KHW87_06960 [Clostridiales bacterium]|nr:hypothetical protein [Clostridiales bacterium]